MWRNGCTVWERMSMRPVMDREGPCSEEEFVALVEAVDEDLARLEKG